MFLLTEDCWLSSAGCNSVTNIGEHLPSNYYSARFGYIHLISARTKELVKSIKMNEPCHSLRFTGDGDSLFSIGEDGQLYVWDVRWEAEDSSSD